VKRMTSRRWGKAGIVGIARAPRPSRRNRGQQPLDESSLTAMATDQIVHLWQISGHLLRETVDSRLATVVVMRRQQYLDELDRRDPATVRGWLGLAF